jgi:hypothetical protein
MRISSRLPICLSLFALGVLALPSRAAEAEKYLPNDSDVVVTFRLQPLLDAPLIKRNLEQTKAALKKNEEYQKVIEALGIDPFKDIELFVVGAPASGGDPDKAVGVLQGKFNMAKMQALAAKASKDNSELLKIEKVGSTELYLITPQSGKQKTTFAAVLDDQFVVASANREGVVDAIDKKAGQKKSELKKSLTELLAKQDTKQAFSIVANEAIGQGELAGLAKSLIGGLTFGDDIKLDFTLNAKDEKAAAALADKTKEGLKTALFIVLALASKDKRFEPLMDVAQGIKVTPVESSVTIKAEMSKDVIDKLEKALKEARLPKKKETNE